MEVMMKSVSTTVFKSNKTQAVRLPKAVALPESIKKVEIVAVGNTRIITPAGESWDYWFDGPGVSDDFMNERDQPADQQREPF
jgi:antitoxin VapB